MLAPDYIKSKHPWRGTFVRAVSRVGEVWRPRYKHRAMDTGSGAERITPFAQRTASLRFWPSDKSLSQDIPHLWGVRARVARREGPYPGQLGERA